MDYRRVDENLFCEDVANKKKELVKKIGKNGIHYDCVRNRSSIFNTEFFKIYKNSCVYCGIGNLFIGRSGLEIDHFICESSFKKIMEDKEVIDREKAGNIDNLVSACSLCNRRKSNLLISKETAAILDIDNNLISNVFVRDKKTFKILINDKFKNNQGILKFYNQLKLGSHLKRLEYLGLKIENILSTKELNNENKIKLYEILTILVKKHHTSMDLN